MQQLLTFPDAQFPPHLKCQVLSFTRVLYWQGFLGPNRLRDWITDPKFHPVHHVLVENDLLISHAEVVWKYLEHAGETYLAYGLTSVLTYPSFRKQGFGTRIVQSATHAILASQTDIALFHCDFSLRSFYEACGWMAMPGTPTYIGPKEAPILNDDEILMMRFLSPKGQAARAAFEQHPLYFDEDCTW